MPTCFDKSLLCYKTIFCSKVALDVQLMIFFIWRKNVLFLTLPKKFVQKLYKMYTKIIQNTKFVYFVYKDCTNQNFVW